MDWTTTIPTASVRVRRTPTQKAKRNTNATTTKAPHPTKLPGGRFTQANWRFEADWSTKLANAQENEQKTTKPTRPENTRKRPENARKTPGKRPENARKTPGKRPENARKTPGNRPENARKTLGKRASLTRSEKTLQNSQNGTFSAWVVGNCNFAVISQLRGGLPARDALLASYYHTLSGSHRLTHIASDLASRALASQAKPQRESESQAFRIA